MKFFDLFLVMLVLFVCVVIFSPTPSDAEINTKFYETSQQRADELVQRIEAGSELSVLKLKDRASWLDYPSVIAYGQVLSKRGDFEERDKLIIRAAKESSDLDAYYILDAFTPLFEKSTETLEHQDYEKGSLTTFTLQQKIRLARCFSALNELRIKDEFQDRELAKAARFHERLYEGSASHTICNDLF